MLLLLALLATLGLPAAFAQDDGEPDPEEFYDDEFFDEEIPPVDDFFDESGEFYDDQFFEDPALDPSLEDPFLQEQLLLEQQMMEEGLLDPALDPALDSMADPMMEMPAEAPPAAPAMSPEAAAALPILLSTRADLELLADNSGDGLRPNGWSGSIDASDPQLPTLVRLDLELLAGTRLGEGNRPAGWFGIVSSTPYAIARDVRHDLELLADAVVQPGVRPPGWTGDDPIMRCNRATQTLVRLLETGGYALQADPNSPTFCNEVEVEVSRLVERGGTAAAPVVAAVPGGSGAVPAPAGSITLDNDFVVAFLDRNARQRVGVIPQGTPVTLVARSANELSNMMVVRGNGFEVFVDYTYTPVTTEQFEALPMVESSNTACTAQWCD
jgi:hypothetical protein